MNNNFTYISQKFSDSCLKRDIIFPSREFHHYKISNKCSFSFEKYVSCVMTHIAIL